jgi:hypothetical protein
MRSDVKFIADYRTALAAVDPASAETMDIEAVRTLAQSELCLFFINRFLPDEQIRTVPFLMMGYPKLLKQPSNGEAEVAMTNLRHLCSRLGSVSAWVDATVRHGRMPETLRCFDVRDHRAKLRTAAPESLLAVLRRWLDSPVPWAQRKVQIADPGEAVVFAERGRTRLAYTIPAIPVDKMRVQPHALHRRTINPPIRVHIDELLAIAKRIDAREALEDWPKDSLPPLNLVKRLEKLQPRGMKGAFFDGQTLSIEGATHVVGMLSSGKSTLVLALLFTLTLGANKKRIATLVSDTIQGATFAARLRRHGVKATVISSLRNRTKHLHGIHWRRSCDVTGWSLSSLGDVSDGFSTACPLDGTQRDPEPIEGARDQSRRFPDFSEKQCHRLYQQVPPDGDDEANDPDDIGSEPRTRSCPLWACCPAQEQQRSSVDAQVLIMTPQAFVHITPDKWTTENHITIPELLQYAFDLVIVDEVDNVQKSLDDTFAPRSPIMGDEQNVYAPNISLRSSEALRERSGVQFRKPVNAKWQSNFFAFFRLVGVIYAILQNERESLKAFYENTPFTAGSILYELWRRRNIAKGMSRSDLTFDNPTFEHEFLELVKVSEAIKGYARTSSISEDEVEQGIDYGPKFEDDRFAKAADALRDVARQTLVADDYNSLVEGVGAMLGGPLDIFNSAGHSEQRRVDSRTNSLALLLATVTELALSHYNWLIKTQSAVARDFGIDDGHLLGQTNSLIKHYRTLLPTNPAGAAFGLFYDEPSDEKRLAMGGKLTLISHLGVGRHLLTHLHDLLIAEGQAGPHVLMLSGTSWAGGSNRRPHPKTREPLDAASPCFDVQVPVSGVLVQPQAELEAIKHSVFALVNVPDEARHQIGISGQSQANRRVNLAIIAARFAARYDGWNKFEDDWRRMGLRWTKWSPTAIDGRRRALLVANSYSDAVVVSESLASALEANGYAGWKVYCLVRDRDQDGSDEDRLILSRPLSRSLIERFGLEPENSILVAPMQIVARGHNILNRANCAAISSIYFLHRPHPRPDDLGPTIGRLNRFAQERFDKGVLGDIGESVASRARRIRHAANEIVRYGLEAGRVGYRSLPAEFKAQFAWDMLTPLWQTVGRGIRGGSPVFTGFVDRAFAPLSFDGNQRGDTAESSVLVQSLRQLEMAMDPKINPAEHEVAKLLYQPFHDALSKTEGLRYA